MMICIHLSSKIGDQLNTLILNRAAISARLLVVSLIESPSKINCCLWSWVSEMRLICCGEIRFSVAGRELVEGRPEAILFSTHWAAKF